jgi:hypothetical protein
MERPNPVLRSHLPKMDTEVRASGFASRAYRLLGQIPLPIPGAALLSRFHRTRLATRRRAPHCVRRAGVSERRIPARRAPCWIDGFPRRFRTAISRSTHCLPLHLFRVANSFFRRRPLRRHHDAFSVDSRKYLDGGNIPVRVNSRPTSFRISSAQSAQVNSLIPRCRRAA